MTDALLPPPDAVVFDFGGVLFNWQPLQLIQQVMPTHARNDAEAAAVASAVFQSFAPGSDWAEFDRGTVAWDTLRERIALRTGLPPRDLDKLMAAIPAHLQPLADTVDWLQRLADAGTRLCFLSNMPAPYAAHLQREHAFLSHFEAGVFSCDVKQIKPDAEIFHTAAERFGVDPRRTVFIDDNVHNIRTATELGWRAVRFEHVAQAEAELKQRGWL